MCLELGSSAMMMTGHGANCEYQLYGCEGAAEVSFAGLCRSTGGRGRWASRYSGRTTLPAALTWLQSLRGQPRQQNRQTPSAALTGEIARSMARKQRSCVVVRRFADEDRWLLCRVLPVVCVFRHNL